MAKNAGQFGSSERPAKGRPNGTKNKLRPLRGDFDQLCKENFKSVEAGRQATDRPLQDGI